MKVVLGVTGGIAAYKAADLTSKLVQRGDQVQVVLTRSARRFVTALTFQSLSGRAVVHDLWQDPPEDRPIHITTSAWGDVLVVAPATANIIGKVAHGIADEILSSTILAAGCPVVIAPAMNDRMWRNPIVQENVKKLEGHGYRIVPPGMGWLADGYSGVGRLAEIPAILSAIDAARPQRPERPGDGEERLLAGS